MSSVKGVLQHSAFYHGIGIVSGPYLLCPCRSGHLLARYPHFLNCRCQHFPLCLAIYF